MSLVQGELGVTPAKGDRLTDWLRRPLTDEQKDYAAADVRYLLELQDRLDVRAAGLGRTEWVEEACEELRLRPTGAIDPKSLDPAEGRPHAAGRGPRPSPRRWRRGASGRRRRSTCRCARCSPTWPCSGSPSASRRRSTSWRSAAASTSATSGSGRPRDRRGGARGQHAAPPPVTSGGDDVDRALRPAVTLMSAWVSQVAKDARIDTACSPRAPTWSRLRGNDPDARLSNGWRAELLGDGIRRLIDGSAGLTFARKGGLRLIDGAGSS